MITMTIMYEPKTNKFSVNGPVEDEVLCYGLLERAKKAVGKVHEKKANAVVAAGAGALHGLEKANGG